MKATTWSEVKPGGYVYLKDSAGYLGPLKVINIDLHYLENDSGEVLKVSEFTAIYVREVIYLITRTVFKGDNMYSECVLQTQDLERAQDYLTTAKIKRLKEGLAIEYETEKSLYMRRVGSPFHMLYNLYTV